MGGSICVQTSRFPRQQTNQSGPHAALPGGVARIPQRLLYDFLHGVFDYSDGERSGEYGGQESHFRQPVEQSDLYCDQICRFENVCYHIHGILPDSVHHVEFQQVVASIPIALLLRIYSIFAMVVFVQTDFASNFETEKIGNLNDVNGSVVRYTD